MRSALLKIFPMRLTPSGSRNQKRSDRIHQRPRGTFDGDRKSQVSKARSVISYVAVRKMGYSGVEVGRILNLSGPGVTKSVEKGKRIISADESLRRKLIS